MNEKKIVFDIVVICFLTLLLTGCRTTKLDDKGAELVWNSAELFGRLGQTTDNLRENNRRFEEGLERLELNSRQFGESSKGLRDAIQNYIEFCRFVVETVGKQDKEIEELRNTINELNIVLDNYKDNSCNTQSKIQD